MKSRCAYSLSESRIYPQLRRIRRRGGSRERRSSDTFSCTSDRRSETRNRSDSTPRSPRERPNVPRAAFEWSKEFRRFLSWRSYSVVVLRGRRIECRRARPTVRATPRTPSHFNRSSPSLQAPNRRRDDPRETCSLTLILFVAIFQSHESHGLKRLIEEFAIRSLRRSGFWGNFTNRPLRFFISTLK